MIQQNLFGLVAGLISIALFGSQLNAQQMTTGNRDLSAKDKSIIAISSFTAQGKLVELKTELSRGLEVGLTVNEVKEMLVHCYAYCGFPRSIRGLQTFMEVMNERQEKGITDKPGNSASPVISDSSKYERGKKTLGLLTGMPQSNQLSGYSAFAPVIDTFLKEHLFADIFERDVLTYAQRELVTISVISAIGDADPMLQSHLGISLHIGWLPDQLKEFIKVISPTIGEPKAKAATVVLEQVLNRRLSR